MIEEFFKDVPEDLKIPLLQHMLTAVPGTDRSESNRAWRMFDLLLRNGCPFDTIVRTLDDMADDYSREAVRAMIGNGFNITFEGE